MENMNVFVARLLPREDFVTCGHRACQGCGEVLAMRMIHKVLGKNCIVSSATGCMEIISSSYPDSAWKIPWIHVAFENAAAVASGVEAAYKALGRRGAAWARGRRIQFIAMGGDGATADIGIQALSGAMERGHDFTYICYDNEAYMNTGIQRSSLTPFGASTTTSPSGSHSIGQSTWKKNMVEIAAAHDIPYTATLNPSYPMDLVAKVKRAMAIPGPKYLHVFSACPTGWRCDSDLSIEIGRLAVATGVAPLYEVDHGRYRITVPTPERLPLQKYLKPQRRFRHLFDAAPGKDGLTVIEQIKRRVDREYAKLELKERMTNG